MLTWLKILVRSYVTYDKTVLLVLDEGQYVFSCLYYYHEIH